jgi:hypothetical protein
MDEGVGTTLKAERHRRKLDLSEAEQATKIRSRFLRAIEDEEWKALPGEAYARAFVRTYATYLGLDGDDLAERQRVLSGTVRPTEQLPQSNPPRSAPVAQPRGRPPTAAIAIAAVALVAVLALVLFDEGGGSPQAVRPEAHGGAGGGAKGSNGGSGHQVQARNSIHSLQLTATDEIWVCLLGAKGEKLVDGQILAPGSVEGPFKSDSFTVSFGNGKVDMTVDGQQASIPETSSPIGFTIGRGGSMQELAEGERPTCT